MSVVVFKLENRRLFKLGQEFLDVDIQNAAYRQKRQAQSRLERPRRIRRLNFFLGFLFLLRGGRGCGRRWCFVTGVFRLSLGSFRRWLRGFLQRFLPSALGLFLGCLLGSRLRLGLVRLGRGCSFLSHRFSS